jgi:hypothetical protein
MQKASPLAWLYRFTIAALPEDTMPVTVEVLGSRPARLGIGNAASDGTVNQKQVETRIEYRPREFFEATPGLVVSPHSGEGRANQSYLRGINLDHGTDLGTTIGGMLVNQRSHAHSQGWTDLNFIVPELTSFLEYSKGPFRAVLGAFSAAGAFPRLNRLWNRLRLYVITNGFIAGCCDPMLTFKSGHQNHSLK